MGDQQRIEKTLVNVDAESEIMLISHTHWVLERMENLNQGIMSRSVSLAGFAGIELSLVGQMVINLRKNVGIKKWSLSSQWVLFGFEATTVICLLFCIGFLLWSVRPLDPGYIPGVVAIRNRLEDSEQPEMSVQDRLSLRTSLPLEQLLNRESSKEPQYGKFLVEENKERGKWFRYGFRILIASQIALGTLVLIAYWR